MGSIWFTYPNNYCGDIELNPGPVNTDFKRKYTLNDQFVSDVYSNSTELVSMNMAQIMDVHNVP